MVFQKDVGGGEIPRSERRNVRHMRDHYFKWRLFHDCMRSRKALSRETPAVPSAGSRRAMPWFYRVTDLQRALLICTAVGSWLVLFNQGNAILENGFTNILYLRIFLDYATPFTVSTLTAILRNRSDRKAKQRFGQLHSYPLATHQPNEAQPTNRESNIV